MHFNIALPFTHFPTPTTAPSTSHLQAHLRIGKDFRRWRACRRDYTAFRARPRSTRDDFRISRDIDGSGGKGTGMRAGTNWRPRPKTALTWKHGRRSVTGFMKKPAPTARRGSPEASSARGREGVAPRAKGKDCPSPRLPRGARQGTLDGDRHGLHCGARDVDTLESSSPETSCFSADFPPLPPMAGAERNAHVVAIAP